MAIPLIGKVVILVVSLGVIGGLTTVVVLTVNSNSNEEAVLPYKVGVGIADMTGPCADITFMGYAELTQRGRGLHMRQFARSFIFVQDNTRIVYVSAEVQAVGLAVRREVVNRLQEKYGDMYRLENVIIAGTHTHSAPGGHLVDFLLDISILGFSRETFNAYVDGITRSIERAHESIVPARLFYGQTKVNDVSMNRSPYSYMYNPEAERNRYDTNTDNTMTQVRIVKEDGSIHGVMTWFSIHTTSMNMTNRLVSSDNLGYSALRLEKELNPGALPGKAKIVAGFFTSNLGDASPNTQGPRCEFSGQECDNHFTLCEAGERCFARGPGADMFESVKIIGTKLFEGANKILNSPGEELTGKLRVIHQFVNMPAQEVSKYNPVTKTFDNSTVVSGCVPAMGYSFASGTQDGANNLNITQGTIVGNPAIDSITGIVLSPTDADRECHAPKPILLATGRARLPLPWHPDVVSASLIWLGSLAILGVPGEPTTMAGRRMMDVVGQVMEDNGISPKVVVTGLTNEYIHYVATFEEYQVQRYEAASTIYGPNTLDIFLNKFRDFAEAAVKDEAVEETPAPIDNRIRAISLIAPVIIDNHQLSRPYGLNLLQPIKETHRGATIRATFMGANPRNDLKQESSHFMIERLEGNDWIPVTNDADFNTKFIWERLSILLGTSRVHIEWTIPDDAVLGVPHRIKYFGASRRPLVGVFHFSGESDTFIIVDRPDTTTENANASY